MNDPNYEMLECNTCASKPGFETLCASCLHNRDLIIKLHFRIDVLEKRSADLERDFLLERDRLAYVRMHLENVAASSASVSALLSAVISKVEGSSKDGTPL